MASSVRQRLEFVIRRVLLIALACAVAFATFASALTIAELHDHDCSGDGCSTCLVLEMAQAMLGSAAAPIARVAAGSAAIAASILILAAWVLSLSAKTPVSEKVLLLI